MEPTSNKKSPKLGNRGSAKARNSAARLLAVQAVYQMHKNEQEAETVIAEFLEHRTGIDADGDEMVTPNVDHFSLVVRGVNEHIAQLGDMVVQNRTQKKAAPTIVMEVNDDGVEVEKEIPAEVFKRSEPLLQAIFLCGAFELMVLQAIDAPLIISDYMHVTHAFFEKGEAKLVNAVLDSIRKTVRD